MDTLQAILLGIVQGITEFLPLTSSGHRQLATDLLGVALTATPPFAAALHAGPVLIPVVVPWL